MLFHCSEDDCRPVILTRRFWLWAHFELYNLLKTNSVAYSDVFLDLTKTIIPRALMLKINAEMSRQN